MCSSIRRAFLISKHSIIKNDVAPRIFSAVILASYVFVLYSMIKAILNVVKM